MEGYENNKKMIIFLIVLGIIVSIAGLTVSILAYG